MTATPHVHNVGFTVKRERKKEMTPSWLKDSTGFACRATERPTVQKNIFKVGFSKGVANLENLLLFILFLANII